MPSLMTWQTGFGRAGKWFDAGSPRPGPGRCDRQQKGRALRVLGSCDFAPSGKYKREVQGTLDPV